VLFIITFNKILDNTVVAAIDRLDIGWGRVEERRRIGTRLNHPRRQRTPPKVEALNTQHKIEKLFCCQEAVDFSMQPPGKTHEMKLSNLCMDAKPIFLIPGKKRNKPFTIAFFFPQQNNMDPNQGDGNLPVAQHKHALKFQPNICNDNPSFNGPAASRQLIWT